MNLERKALISSLLEHYQPKDARDILDMPKDLLGDMLQGMLEVEMDDNRNGYSPKTVISSNGYFLCMQKG